MCVMRQSVMLKGKLYKLIILSSMVKFLELAPTACAQPKPSEKLICFGNAFVTRLVETLLDRNRENLQKNEPNSLGEHDEHIGLFYLHNPRLFNLSKGRIHGEITVDCTSNPVYAVLRIPLMVPGFVFIYDYIFPGYLAYGKVIITSDNLGMIFTIETPLAARSTERTIITSIDVFRSDDFKLSFTGLGPVTRALSSVFYVAYRVFPSVPLGLFTVLTVRILQEYIDNNPLPL